MIALTISVGLADLLDARSRLARWLCAERLGVYGVFTAMAATARPQCEVTLSSTFSYVALTYHSRRRTLLTGFAMRSDPKGFSEVSAPLTAEAQALGARELRPGSVSY